MLNMAVDYCINHALSPKKNGAVCSETLKVHCTAVQWVKRPLWTHCTTVQRVKRAPSTHYTAVQRVKGAPSTHCTTVQRTK